MKFAKLPGPTIKFTAALMLSALCGVVGAHAQTGFFSFDVPGASFTSPHEINAAGTVVGEYFISGTATHGFLRASNGQITTFDAPGAISTQPVSINDQGQIVGNLVNSGVHLVFHGFMRAKSANFTKVDAPGFENTLPQWISNSGLIVGYAYNQNDSRQAFLRDA
ncbi:MAG TPA: hypothetical protein VLK33_07380, partial [Terriglobales bacterium]|nr:hypothetical protein [Terriglobales bacterium]